jgi:hypothetical protein
VVARSWLTRYPVLGTFKKAWGQVDPDQTGYIPQNRFSELLTVSFHFPMAVYVFQFHLLPQQILPEPFYEPPYKNDLSLRRLVDQCEVSSTIVGSPTIISGARHTIDVRKLESVLLDADRETLSERRRRMNELYQEAKLEEEPGKGICFQSTLLLLARYMLIDEREALTCVMSYPLYVSLYVTDPVKICTGLMNGKSGEGGKRRSFCCVGLARTPPTLEYDPKH